jgi:hypothetical protein
MNTFQEVVAFTGVTGPAGQRTGTPSRQPTMRTVADLVPLLSTPQRTSLRQMILGLQSLPPISLQAEIVGATGGETPFKPDIRVHPSTGVVLETVLTYERDGILVPTSTGHALVDGDEVLPGDGNAVRSVFSDLGAYVAKLRRVGITSNGVTLLEKTFKFGISAHPGPQPPQQPQPPVNSGPTCSMEQDNEKPGFNGITNFRIFGVGFGKGETVNIINENAQIAKSPVANSSGEYETTEGILHAKDPTKRTRHAVGATSGRVSNTTGVTL